MQRRDQARPFVEEAARYEAAGNYAQAVQAYRRALAVDAENLDAACRLARCCEALRQWSGAVEAWRHAADLRPDQLEIRIGLAEALRQARCHRAAVEAYAQALDLHPGHLFGLAGMGETLRMLGDHESALTWLDRALAVHPDHAFALRGKAATLAALQRHEEALPLWNQALEIEPRSAFAIQGRDETRRRIAEGSVRPTPPPAPPAPPPARLRAEHHGEWARALAADGRHAEAVDAWRSAISEDPTWVEALADLASTLEDSGRWDDACEVYRRVVEEEPDRVDANCNVAETLRKADRYEEALVAYDKTLALDATYVFALAGRAEALRMLGRNEEALIWFDRALDRKPTHAFAMRGKAATLNVLERFDEAAVLWRRSLDVDPGAEFAISGLRTSEAGMARRQSLSPEASPPRGDPTRSKARAHFDMGRAWLQQSRYRDAIQALRKAAEADPTWEEPWFLQGVAYEEDRQYHQAIRAFEACMVRAPDHAEAALHKGDCQRKNNDLGDALASYEVAIELAPGDLRPLAGRAETLRLLGQFDAALQGFDQVLSAQPRHYYALCGKAATLNALHRFEEARPLWLAAREENPGSSFVKKGLAHCDAQVAPPERPVTGDRRAAREALERGRAAQKAGQLDVAIQAYDQASDLDPTWAEPALRLGIALEDDKQYTRAIEAYELALRLDPTCYQAATNSGEAHRKHERYREALDAYDRALAIRKDYLYALAGRAECMRMLGQHKDSLSWFDRALQQEPRHTFAIQGKASALNSLHRFIEALPLWLQALEIDPQSQFALDGKAYCEAQLRRLGKKEPEEAAPAPAPAESPTPTLDEQGRDLTALARAGRLPEVIGRETEVRALMKTLVRRQKANPLLLGDPGVGKTAVVEGLARALVRDDAPERLRGLRIIELSMGSLVAGTKYRGTFEDRLKTILKEARENPGIVLFIDEIHTLVGAGRTEGGSLDAANILKPALARGEVAVIGATTVAEFRKHIEADSALERRFQPIPIEEPSAEQALDLLRKVQGRYADHHQVEVDDAALRACVSLSVRFVPDRRLPDKALDLLDESAAEASLEGHPVVTSTIVAKVLSDRTGIPVGQLTSEEREKLAKIEQTLGSQVKGQPAAIDRLARSVRLCRSGLRDPRKPRGVFLFVGPSGVGKTELARQLADLLFPEGNAFVRLDMSEYSEKFTVSRLIGAPPGYAGHGEPGQLTGKLRRRPYAVVLLDEFEKAHPEVQTLFLSLFDEGHLTDAEGREVDAREAFFILTSNAGTELATKGRVGFGGRKGPLDVGLMLEQVRAQFRPELVNRIDEVVPFGPLDEHDLEDVAALHLAALANRAAAEGVTLTWDTEVARLCARIRRDPALGARPVLRAIDTLVGEPLGNLLVTSPTAARRALHARVDHDQVRFDEVLDLEPLELAEV